MIDDIVKLPASKFYSYSQLEASLFKKTQDGIYIPEASLETILGSSKESFILEEEFEENIEHLLELEIAKKSDESTKLRGTRSRRLVRPKRYDDFHYM